MIGYNLLACALKDFSLMPYIYAPFGNYRGALKYGAAGFRLEGAFSRLRRLFVFEALAAEAQTHAALVHRTDRLRWTLREG